MTTVLSDQSSPICKPFVKWAGGKRQLLGVLNKHAPEKFERYFEPFVGGGALFFHLVTTKPTPFAAYLSDINTDLINTYRVIKDNVEDLIALLNNNQIEYNKNPRQFYYGLRSKTDIVDDVERAARFITLNRTCFNGLYRVNKKGIFNVPMGDYRNPLICDSVNLRNVSMALQRSNATIAVNNYKLVLQSAKRDDFVYIDPPYKPASKTSNFTAFTNKGFNDNDQKALYRAFKSLDRRGCKIILNNSNTSFIRNLYKEYSSTMIEVRSRRSINCKANKRIGHTDLLIKNFPTSV